MYVYLCQLWYGTMLTEYVYKGIFFWISGISSKSIAEQREQNYKNNTNYFSERETKMAKIIPIGFITILVVSLVSKGKYQILQSFRDPEIIFMKFC